MKLLVKGCSFFSNGTKELFNLIEDLYEEVDLLILSNDFVEIVNELEMQASSIRN